MKSKHKKTYSELTDKQRKKLGKKFHKYSGADGFTIFLFVVIALALCFSVPFGVLGFVFMGEGELWLIGGIIGCVLTVLLIGSIFLVRLWRWKRLAKNEKNLALLLKDYNKDTLVECCKFWKQHHWFYMFFDNDGPTSPEAKALQNAAMRAAWGHSSSGSYSSSSSSVSTDNTIRVKLKDGGELHTEERFGDYKTYLYDKDGNNTRLHIHGDKVLDDNFNEVGSFDSNGNFNSKN